MAYPPLAVANSFVSMAIEENDPVTPMKLQKLVYYANGWWMAINKGRPLIDGEFQAWKFGPVNPEIYHAFCFYGQDPISELGEDPEDYFSLGQTPPLIRDGETQEFLMQVWKGYGHFSGVELSKMTHEENTAWMKTFDPEIRHNTIPDSLIHKEFSSKMG